MIDTYTFKTPNLYIDLALGIIESLVMLFIGEVIGRSILKIASARKMGYSSCFMSALLTFFAMCIVALGISFIYYKAFNYYSLTEFKFSICLLTSVCSMFVLETILESYSTYYAEYLNNSYAKEMELLQAKNTALATEMHNLNLRADTHFIFNNLSILRGLMEEDRNEQAAKDFVSQLLDVSKYISTKSSHPTCPIEDELTLLDNYFSLIKVRFPEGLILNVDKDLYGVSGEIPPTSLMSLVANAIKHNAHARTKPLSIHISLEEDTIIVSNKIQKLFSTTESSGMGLSLLRQQYENLNDDRMEVNNDGESFTVRIPILNFEKS